MQLHMHAAGALNAVAHRVSRLTLAQSVLSIDPCHGEQSENLQFSRHLRGLLCYL
jgi:hypothetical protein